MSNLGEWLKAHLVRQEEGAQSRFLRRSKGSAAASGAWVIEHTPPKPSVDLLVQFDIPTGYEEHFWTYIGTSRRSLRVVGDHGVFINPAQIADVEGTSIRLSDSNPLLSGHVYVNDSTRGSVTFAEMIRVMFPGGDYQSLVPGAEKTIEEKLGVELPDPMRFMPSAKTLWREPPEEDYEHHSHEEGQIVIFPTSAAYSSRRRSIDISQKAEKETEQSRRRRLLGLEVERCRYSLPFHHAAEAILSVGAMEINASIDAAVEWIDRFKRASQYARQVYETSNKQDSGEYDLPPVTTTVLT